jgi:hypothetical protein
MASDLLPTERRFTSAMDDLGFGRFEHVPIAHGELVLDPWPTTVRGVKFGAESPVTTRTSSGEFELKRQVVEFFQYVRAVEKGEIRSLEVRHSIPFSMEIERQPERAAGDSRG